MQTDPLAEPGDDDDFPTEANDSPEPIETETPEPVAAAPEPEGEPPPDKIVEGDKPAEHIEVEPDTPEQKYKNMQAAMKEERIKRRALETELSGLNQKFDQFSNLKTELDAHRAAQTTEEEKAAQKAKDDAAFDENPATYLRQKQEEMSAQQEAVLSQNAENETANEQFNQAALAISSQVNAYKETDTNYNDKLAFAQTYMYKQYEVKGIPKEYHEQQFNMDCFNMGVDALQRGVNPGEVVNMYVESWGYKAPAAPDPDPKPGETAEERVARLEAGAQAAQDMTGGEPDEPTALQAIEKMSDKEFDKHWDENVIPQRSH